jgi:tRNA A-37 threonylcarbamoyl transferase component Bud32
MGIESFGATGFPPTTIRGILAVEGRLTEFAIGSDFAGYQIEGILGRGGMGIVYLAGEQELGRQVALKVIRAELADDQAFRRRFASESRAAAAIEHPRVISVYRAGEHHGRPYLAMRYVPGRNLQARIATEGRLRPASAASLINEVAEGLDAIHAAGLVHRDVKPANIIVSGRSDRMSAYLTDFGLAKAATADTGVTRTGEVIGSLDYLAPEQIEGTRVDARTDVYALGCVLFELVTGEVPFPRPESSAKLWAHLNEPPPSARRAGDRDLIELDRVVRRAMAKAPDDRFPSAGDLGRAAIAAAAGEAVTDPERPVGVGEAAAETMPIASEPAGTTRPLPTEVMAPKRAHQDRPRKRRRRMRLAAAVVLLTGVGLAGAAAMDVLPSTDETGPAGDSGPPTVELPGLEGERLDLAERELGSLGLRSRAVGGGLLGIVIAENWEVCDTSPEAGEGLRPGATVELLVDRPGAC